MLVILLAAVSAQATPAPVLPRFPGCPPEAVSSQCAPPPPPPPHRWDDATLQAIWQRNFDAWTKLDREAGSLRYAAEAGRSAIAGEPMDGAGVGQQRVRLLRVKAIEEQLVALGHSVRATANEHRAAATPGDVAAFDRMAAALDAGRLHHAVTESRLLFDLIDRPMHR